MMITTLTMKGARILGASDYPGLVRKVGGMSLRIGYEIEESGFASIAFVMCLDTGAFVQLSVHQLGLIEWRCAEEAEAMRTPALLGAPS